MSGPAKSDPAEPEPAVPQPEPGNRTRPLLIKLGVLAVIAAAVTLADNARLITVFSAEHYYDRGVSFHQAGQKDEALTEYRRAWNKDPDAAEAYFASGLIRSAEGDHAGALLEFNRAADAARRRKLSGISNLLNTQLLFRILGAQATAAERAGDEAAAERALKEVDAKDWPNGTDRGWAQFRLARRALARGAPAEALALLDALVAGSPDATYKAVLRLERARARLALGDRSGALEDLNGAVESAPDGATWSSIIDAGAASFGVSGTPLDEVFGSSPIRSAYVEALTERARLLREDGNRTAALADLDKALKAAPQSMEIRRLRDETAGLPN